MVSSATLYLGLGGRYFGKVAEDYGTERLEYRMNIALQEIGGFRFAAVYPPIGRFNEGYRVPSLLLGDSGGVISDLHQTRLGIIPDGSQGVNFDNEFATTILVDESSGFLTGNVTFPDLNLIRTMSFYGTINTLPNPGETPELWALGIIPNPTDPGAIKFGFSINSSGQILAMYNNVAVITSSAVTVGQPVHLVLSRTIGTSTDTVRLYVNKVLVGTATPAHTALTVDGTLSSMTGADLRTIPTQFVGVTVYSVVVGTVELTLSQIEGQYDSLQWTEIRDVLRRDTVTIERGIRDDAPTSRVAGTGMCQLSLNNAEDSSGGLGYYSPGHVNCRPGFEDGIPALVVINDVDQFFGSVDGVRPSPGFSGDKSTRITIRDIFDVAGNTRMTNIPIQTDVRCDQVFTILTERLPNQPRGIDIQLTNDVYPIALDNTQDETKTVLTEYVNLQTCELGYTYTRRDGTLTSEARDSRVVSSSDPVMTFIGSTVELDVAQLSRETINQVEVTVHPRKIDAAATTVLWALEELVRVNHGETKTLNGPYRNPATPTLDARVGGIEMVDPVATTDYQLNTALDGTGLDLTTFLVVTASFGANQVELTILNTHPIYDGYLVAAGGGGAFRLQVRGKGIYDFRTAILIAKDQALIDKWGLNPVQFDMLYQVDPNLGQGAADLILNTWKMLKNRARTMKIIGSDPRFDLDALLQLEISDRIRVTEQVSATDSEYYINGIRIELDGEGHVYFTFWLTPADPLTYWVLGQVGASELDFTTRLYYL